MINANQLIEVGKIQKTHGLKGELNASISNDIFDTVKKCPYLVLEIDGIYVPFFIDEYRFRSDETILLKFLDIDSQEDAKELTNHVLYFDRKCFSKKEEKEYDEAAEDANDNLIGYTIVDATLGTLGTVVDIDDQTVNVLFVVDYKDRELLIPAVDELIEEIDDENQTIHMNLPLGLVNLDDAESENDE